MTSILCKSFRETLALQNFIRKLPQNAAKDLRYRIMREELSLEELLRKHESSLTKSLKLRLWRAVDGEGTILDVVVQHRRNAKAATRLLSKLLRNQGIKPQRIVTDRLGSYGAALKLLGLKIFTSRNN